MVERLLKLFLISGVETGVDTMRRNCQRTTEIPDLSVEKRDPLWKLLSEDAKAHPIGVSPWFAARVAARADESHQPRWIFSLLGALRHYRWALPLPMAGVAAAFILLMQHSSFQAHSRTFSSTESEFEQHMEMIASNDFSL